MGFKIRGLFNDEDYITTESKGIFSVIEYVRDLTVSPTNAMYEYFMSKMDVRRKQVICRLDGTTGVTMQAGAMQWLAGDVHATTGLKGAGDFLGKVIKGAVTNESAIKPEYKGRGVICLEPTYKYILLEQVEDWRNGLVIQDGMFLACESSVSLGIQARKSISSAVAGNEGLFNLKLKGNGTVVLESNVIREQLIEIELEDDVLKTDGNQAVCWSGSLDFTVERSGKTLIGSAVSGEGLVNVFRGTGKILLSPLDDSTSLYSSTRTKRIKNE